MSKLFLVALAGVAVASSGCALLKRCPGSAGCPQQPVENFAALSADAAAPAGVSETAAAK